ncbi:hypothetical protein L227DRAFT_230459 [Lentinus tigrinus ALCF2SS1-6]|uniref:Uncharacterized protein n=1 Tax=Lentinus tigrinus ALCF2SS1-6 TaxID=1328759 RepID=A0A5C2S1M3_9APHY|nr:hypothetical protein L227DRAFT_230459 [Lentinus tigrinus ALCF2SS1-6]
MNITTETGRPVVLANLVATEDIHEYAPQDIPGMADAVHESTPRVVNTSPSLALPTVPSPIAVHKRFRTALTVSGEKFWHPLYESAHDRLQHEDELEAGQLLLVNEHGDPILEPPAPANGITHQLSEWDDLLLLPRVSQARSVKHAHTCHFSPYNSPISTALRNASQFSTQSFPLHSYRSISPLSDRSAHCKSSTTAQVSGSTSEPVPYLTSASCGRVPGDNLPERRLSEGNGDSSDVDTASNMQRPKKRRRTRVRPYVRRARKRPALAEAAEVQDMLDIV